MTFLTTKNPTQWINPSGQGFINFIGNIKIVTNTGINIVTNTTILPILTTPLQSTFKNITAWSGTGV